MVNFIFAIIVIFWSIFEYDILKELNILKLNNKLNFLGSIILSLFVTFFISFLYFLFFKDIMIELFIIRIIMFFLSYLPLTYFYYNKCEKVIEANLSAIFLRFVCILLYFPF